MRLVPSAILAVLLASPCIATEITFEIHFAGGLDRPARKATLVASPTSNAGGRVEQVVTIPGSTVLDLEPMQTWQVSVEGAGLWSPRRWVVVEPEATVRLTVHPTGVIRGRFRSEGVEVPGSARVRFESSPGQGVIGREETLCPVDEDGAWQCEVPAPGPLDLRVSVDGFVALYFWDRRVSAETLLDVGSATLERGASVSGFVELGLPTGSEKPILVELIPYFSPSPLNAGHLDPEQRRQSRGKSSTVRANSRGFFLFREVEPGNYLLVARHADFAPAQRGVVRVHPDLETQILDALVLYPPVDLKVFVDPPLDPFGRQWHGGIRGTAGEMGAQEIDFSASGYWEMKDLAIGGYELTLFDPETYDTWHRRTLDLTLNQSPIEIQVPMLLVNGTIKMGSEPLQAMIYREGDSLRDSLRSKPIIVTVERRGGELILDFPDYDPDDPYAASFKILYEDAELSLLPLLDWAKANGISPSDLDPSAIAIPNVAAGQYAACTWDGSKCSNAYLTEGGQAYLTAPATGGPR